MFSWFSFILIFNWCSSICSNWTVLAASKYLDKWPSIICKSASIGEIPSSLSLSDTPSHHSPSLSTSYLLAMDMTCFSRGVIPCCSSSDSWMLGPPTPSSLLSSEEGNDWTSDIKSAGSTKPPVSWDEPNSPLALECSLEFFRKPSIMVWLAVLRPSLTWLKLGDLGHVVSTCNNPIKFSTETIIPRVSFCKTTSRTSSVIPLEFIFLLARIALVNLVTVIDFASLPFIKAWGGGIDISGGQLWLPNGFHKLLITPLSRLQFNRVSSSMYEWQNIWAADLIVLALRQALT